MRISTPLAAAVAAIAASLILRPLALDLLLESTLVGLAAGAAGFAASRLVQARENGRD